MLLSFAAVTMVITAAIHSVVGERRLIMPLFEVQAGIVAVPLARQVLRFAWHLTGILMIACAAVLVVPGTPSPVLEIIGWAWLAPGLLDAVYTRGRHIGWPLLVVAGVLPLAHVTAGR